MSSSRAILNAFSIMAHDTHICWLHFKMWEQSTDSWDIKTLPQFHLPLETTETIDITK